jgi:hypothetical protein
MLQPPGVHRPAGRRDPHLGRHPRRQVCPAQPGASRQPRGAGLHDDQVPGEPKQSTTSSDLLAMYIGINDASCM